MSLMGQVCGFMLCLFVGALGLTIIVWIWIGKIDLSAVLNEPSGEASMSRFQLLIFTFVIAISFFEVVEMRPNANVLPDIPNGVLTLLGISASTYAVSKGITYSQPQITKSGTGDGGDGGAIDDAVNAAQAAATQAAAHAATAQQAVQLTATNAAKAQQAADQATGSQT